MSEAKNTALGGSAYFGYSHVSPAKHLRQFPTTTLMITATLILSALVLLTVTDDSTTRSAG